MIDSREVHLLCVCVCTTSLAGFDWKKYTKNTSNYYTIIIIITNLTPVLAAQPLCGVVSVQALPVFIHTPHAGIMCYNNYFVFSSFPQKTTSTCVRVHPVPIRLPEGIRVCYTAKIALRSHRLFVYLQSYYLRRRDFRCLSKIKENLYSHEMNIYIKKKKTKNLEPSTATRRK